MDLARPVLAAHMIAMHFNSDGLHLKCAKREGAGDDDTKLDVFCTMVTILICAIGQEFFWVGIISSPHSPPRPTKVAFFKGDGECWSTLGW